MNLHVIIGAGPVGAATAELLAERGEKVRLLSRSGRGLSSCAVEALAADATDTSRLAELAAGAAVLCNCASPAYNRWPQEWPTLAASVLASAERTGAVLVTMSNLYGYGPVNHPLTEHDPLHATGRALLPGWKAISQARRVYPDETDRPWSGMTLMPGPVHQGAYRANPDRRRRPPAAGLKHERPPRTPRWPALNVNGDRSPWPGSSPSPLSPSSRSWCSASPCTCCSPRGCSWP